MNGQFPTPDRFRTPQVVAGSPLPARPRRRAAVLAPLAFVAIAARPAGLRAADPYAALSEPGTALLMRHALTEPGLGDPPGFRLGECATQRNLSAAGREQARRTGERLRERRIPIAAVLSSRWCRCLETAQLAFGEVTGWPALDSFFEDASARGPRTAALLARVRGHATGGVLVMVTHQVNITAATGQVPAMGEAFAVRAGPKDTLRIVGRYPFA